MSAETWAVYAVDSTEPKYVNATYTIDEVTDPGEYEGWFDIFVDLDDGSQEGVASFDANNLAGQELLEAIDAEIKSAGRPPRGRAVVEP
ncbi:hypothetical protein ACT17_28200 [Mycolicibacterium conceptionense]|uniref:Uncharacterized protein n=1 Tax=Mycolicibacterium conceptionense TaxID=451644 RepID=A0A0J8U0J9_9MYCO|nr:hypothetical protein [Mycolicibacterium conceptionense]KMV14827.1 hypothetical protein ACT17_28200 [Mycolicibacterium conceptionense]